MRYVKNNFFDGDRQDSYDILTGAWIAKRGGIPPLTDTRPLLMRAVSYNIRGRVIQLMIRCHMFWLLLLLCFSAPSPFLELQVCQLSGTQRRS
jgi:hypothetical protein